MIKTLAEEFESSEVCMGDRTIAERFDFFGAWEGAFRLLKLLDDEPTIEKHGVSHRKRHQEAGTRS